MPHDEAIIARADYKSQGYLFIDQLLSKREVKVLCGTLDSMPTLSAGDRRLLDQKWCRDLVPVILGRLKSRQLICGSSVAVLCTFFDKTNRTNWGVAPHRDICVPLTKTFSAPGWANWTLKQGIPHVQPPNDFLNRLFAVRVNVDRGDRSNGALLITPGSHASNVEKPPDKILEGDAGDALMMSPLLLHASRKSKTGAQRRVLHFLFGPAEIDEPAAWFYAV